MILFVTERPLRRFILPALFVGILFATLWIRRPDTSGPNAQHMVFSGQTMGTVFSVKVRPDSSGQGEAAIERALIEELGLVIQAMSTYEKTSEISLWNQRTVLDPIEISAPLRDVLTAAKLVHEASDGAFDVTVQPLVDLWGFGPTSRTKAPSAEQIQSALEHIGWQQLDFDPKARRLGKKKSGVWLDLSAIAKGYAVDRISDRLLALGYANHFVEIGGEVRTRGVKTKDLPWRVGIEDPKGERSHLLSMPLKDLSIATSGSYRNYRKYGEKTFSHTLDPRTGRPTTHRLVSVSVVAKTCMLADTWATAFFALGPEEGLKLASKLELAVNMIEIDDKGRITEHRTNPFKALVKNAIIPTKAVDR